MTAVVVDDERLAREELLYLLRSHPDIEVLACAGNLDEAERAVSHMNPDVVFLDVHLNRESGFDLIARLEYPCRIVFVTGYDQYAIRAFEINALDYILKPVVPSRLATAIARLRGEVPKSTAADGRLTSSDTVFLETRTKSYFARVAEFVCILAAGDYSEVVTADGKRALILSPLKDWENRLPERHFARIHRSSIINLDRVQEMRTLANNAYLVQMEGMDEPLRMSRRYAARVKSQLS